MIYIHSNNYTVKRINVSKIANTNTQGDNSTAAGCDSRRQKSTVVDIEQNYVTVTLCIGLRMCEQLQQERRWPRCRFLDNFRAYYNMSALKL